MGLWYHILSNLILLNKLVYFILIEFTNYLNNFKFNEMISEINRVFKQNEINSFGVILRKLKDFN